jgi:hypothetical protein
MTEKMIQGCLLVFVILKMRTTVFVNKVVTVLLLLVLQITKSVL